MIGHTSTQRHVQDGNKMKLTTTVWSEALDDRTSTNGQNAVDIIPDETDEDSETLGLFRWENTILAISED